MNKQDVIVFFDQLASSWDADMIKDDEIIESILDHVKLQEGMDVLDVACGTGVMFPYYLRRKVNSVTAIDISSEMVKIASEKNKDNPKVKVICGDVEESEELGIYDTIVVYNAFPHFPDADRLIQRLSSLVKPGGYVTVAHGMSRERINAHHSGAAAHVSNGLMTAEELSEIFARYLDVETVISDDKMYQVAGRKR